MAATPFAMRAIHFDDVSMSSIGSPFSAAAPTSVDYLNAQLVAHGFAHGHGLNLSDLRGKDQQTVLKCLANMLGQRLDDMGRAEQLSTKYKTLSYDYERLLEQHNATKEIAARAERDMEIGKARVDSANKKLSTEEDAHKKSKDDLQKLRMAMQYLRTTTSNELKRKEKDIEKMTDRWGKISNEQVKLGTIGAGLACSNLLPEQPMSEENSMWEAALADSEAARLKLLNENDAFRDVILGCANALQSLHTAAVSAITKVELEEPELILSDTLFMSSSAGTQAETAHGKLRELFGNLREALSKVGSLGNSRKQSVRQREEDAQQLQALLEANESLKAQLRDAQTALETQGQQLLEQFVTDARFMAGQRQVADMSVELMATPNREAIVEELEEQRKHLAAERDKYTEATLKLGREKAAFEAERLQFLEDRRRSKLQSVLDDLPPTPDPIAKPSLNPTLTTVELPLKVDRLAPPSRKDKRPAVSITASQPMVPALDPTPIPLTLPPAFSTNPAPPKHIPEPVIAQRAALQASTTPPMPDEEISPTSPTDQLNPLRSSPEQKLAVLVQPPVAPAIPPSFRTQKTPKRPMYSQARVQHKYSPAVPSPLSRMVRTIDSPPPSPESKAQKEMQRPSVIQEEDEEDLVQSIRQERSPEPENNALPVPEVRPGSLSPLSRIMNMGLSPAIAPTLAVSSFPGLLGTGSLAQDLLARPKQGVKGFGDMPVGLQLSTVIQKQRVLPVAPPASKLGTSKTIKTQIRSTPAVKPSKPKKELVVLAENRPRSSKESTSSDGSGSSGSDRKSASSTTSGKRVTTIKPQTNRNPKAKLGADSAKEKENINKTSLPTKRTVTVKKTTSTVRPPTSVSAPSQGRKAAPVTSVRAPSALGWKG